MNIVFLREHNRVAGLLAARVPGLGRRPALRDRPATIMIVLLLKLVVEEYIMPHRPVRLRRSRAVPFIADEERWNRPNWFAIEFNLLYRWHSLVPDAIGDGAGGADLAGVPQQQPTGDLARASSRWWRSARGPGPAGSACSTRRRSSSTGRRRTGRRVEERTIALMRQARLRSFNDYREAYGLRRMTSFDDLTSDPRSSERLEALYGDIDKLEWYVGDLRRGLPRLHDDGRAADRRWSPTTPSRRR